MRCLVGFVCVLALVVMGCGETAGGGEGGVGGDSGAGGGCGAGGDGGGIGGDGGSAGSGASGGCCGEGGYGGSAGVGGGGAGGDGGSGGFPTISSGLWTGGGLTGAGGTGGPGRPWSICFTVNEASTALTADPFDCMGLAILVDFDGCGTLRVRNDIPIVGGSFEVEALDNAIRGSFRNGTRAMGLFSVGLQTCIELWNATPAD
jgi:hypothetical protein